MKNLGRHDSSLTFLHQNLETSANKLIGGLILIQAEGPDIVEVPPMFSYCYELITSETYDGLLRRYHEKN